jgi:hypothetical protein
LGIRSVFGECAFSCGAIPRKGATSA